MKKYFETIKYALNDELEDDNSVCLYFEHTTFRRWRNKFLKKMPLKMKRWYENEK